MGRTLLIVQSIQQTARSMAEIQTCFTSGNQPHSDRLFVRVRCYTQAATDQCHDNPMEAILLSMCWIKKSGFHRQKVIQNAGVLYQLQGWILDLYPNTQGMTLWLIDRNQSHYRLTDDFAPAFYVSELLTL